MKNLLSCLLVGVLMVCTGCSFFKTEAMPAAKKLAAEKLASAIVKAGECMNHEVVLADVSELLKIESDESIVVKALGEQAPEGAQAQGVASEICKVAAKLALPALLKKGVPKAWGCSLENLSSKIEELSAKACDQIPI